MSEHHQASKSIRSQDQHNQTPQLPPPSPDAAIHSEQLRQKICADIQNANDFLPFDRYLEAVLYAPGLGYYMTGTARFGVSGDFITAPEISELFGYCIAEKLIPLLTQLHDPVILEVGAGTGKLAYDILSHFKHRAQPMPRYWILELSPEAQARQREQLRPFGDRITFLNQLPTQPFQGVILGNEVLDALPFSIYDVENGHVYERGVTLDADHQLSWTRRPTHIHPPEALIHHYALSETNPSALPETNRSSLSDEHIDSSCREKLNSLSKENPSSSSGEPSSALFQHTFEICHRLKPFLTSLTTCLEKGGILMIDYGHLTQELYHPSRSRGTFQCHYRHHVHEDPFFLPGLEDITAHVDFSRVLESLSDQGFQSLEYSTQMDFLIQNGIERLIDTPPSLTHRNALKRLLLPTLMGEVFKVVFGWKDKNPLR